MHREQALKALNDAAHESVSAQTLADTLHQIAVHALRLVGGDTSNGSCHLALVWGDRIQFVAASSQETLARLQVEVGVLDPDRNSNMGLIGRVVRTGEPAMLPDAPLDPDYILFEPNTRSELIVPIRHDGQIIGVINIEHPSPGFFSPEDRDNVEALAAQAAVAIHNAQLLDQRQIVAEISREVNVEQRLDAFLDTLFTRLLELFSSRQIRVFPSLATYDPKDEALLTHDTRFYPTNVRPSHTTIHRNSIMSYVARERKHHYSHDVTQDKFYNLLLPETRSEIAVPLFFGDELLGVLDLESPTRNAFIPQDIELLRRLGRHIATTIHNVRQYEKITQTQAMVDARTAVARWGMVATTSKHSMSNELAAASLLVTLAKHQLQSSSSAEAASSLQKLHEQLEHIKRMPLNAPLGPEEGVTCVNLCELLSSQLAYWGDHAAYRHIHFEFASPMDDRALVRVSPDWLNRVMEILIQNAAEAMEESPSKVLTVTARRLGSGVEAVIADTGQGIPDEIQSQLFRNRIDKANDSKGVGLLIAQLIIATYGGDIRLLASNSEGTSFLFWLPTVD
jgi:GAF domain-containing protein